MAFVVKVWAGRLAPSDLFQAFAAERKKEGRRVERLIKGLEAGLRREPLMLHGFCFLSLSEGAALDLVAVLSALELLVVRLVLAGDESRSELEGGGLSQTNIGSKTTDLAGNSFHAFFASDD